LEITRDIAIRFNNAYGDVFNVPEPYIGKAGARVMSLTEPTAKMSKSDENENSYISMLDKPEVIQRKIRRAVTDSDGIIRYDEEKKPGVSNLISMLSAITGSGFEDIEKQFDGQGYGQLKAAVSDAICEELAPLQAEYDKIRADKAYLAEVMKNGAQRAGRNSVRVLRKVHKKVGFVPRES